MCNSRLLMFVYYQCILSVVDYHEVIGSVENPTCDRKFYCHLSMPIGQFAMQQMLINES